MIIVEGPDGAGKTTLVKALAEKYSLPISPRIVSSDTESLIESKKVWVEQNVSRGFQMTLFDRHCLISEPIYNSVTRKVFEPGFDDVGWLTAMNTMMYKWTRPLIIYCLPPYSTVRANVEADTEGQPASVINGIRKIYAQYAAVAARDVVLGNAMVYDYTITPKIHLERQVELALERMQHV